MVESNPAYNNSVDRIISKEKEREDPRRELQSPLHSSSNPRVSPVIPCNSNPSTVSPHVIQPSHAILHTELILPQEILQLQGSSHANQYKASSSDCSRASKHSTQQNPAIRPLQHTKHSRPTSRLPAILPGRNSILSSSQHPRSPYSSSQANSTPLGITEFYQEKQDSFQKGQVLYIYAILRSVCSKLLIRIIPQEY